MQERKLYLNLGPKPNAWSLSLTTRPWVLFALIVEAHLSMRIKRNPNLSSPLYLTIRNIPLWTKAIIPPQQSRTKSMSLHFYFIILFSIIFNIDAFIKKLK